MNDEKEFRYSYRAPENQEVLQIRNKYLPQKETKLEELKRLDCLVQASGVTAALCAGIGGFLLFLWSLYLSMGDLVWIGCLFGLLGAAGMTVAYPIHKKAQNRAKEKYVPRILELTSELSNNTNI